MKSSIQFLKRYDTLILYPNQLKNKKLMKELRALGFKKFIKSEMISK